MSVELYRGSPGKFDSRTLSRTTLSRWTGRTHIASYDLVCPSLACGGAPTSTLTLPLKQPLNPSLKPALAHTTTVIRTNTITANAIINTNTNTNTNATINHDGIRTNTYAMCCMLDTIDCMLSMLCVRRCAIHSYASGTYTMQGLFIVCPIPLALFS